MHEDRGAMLYEPCHAQQERREAQARQQQMLAAMRELTEMAETHCYKRSKAKALSSLFSRQVGVWGNSLRKASTVGRRSPPPASCSARRQREGQK